MRPGLLQDQKKLVKFSDVREQVAQRHSLNLPDVVAEMSKIKIADTKDAALELPGGKVYCLTSWARSQLGSMLGVQWDKWFNPKYVNPNDVQDEIQKRFRNSKESKKLRICRFDTEDAPALKAKGYDGYLRAVLGPTYASIDDERLFARMSISYRGQLDKYYFMKHMVNGKHWGNDHCSYYTMVTDPINMGDLDRNHPDQAVRRIYDLAEKEGKLPSADWVYPGLQLRNSEVGYTAVIINEFHFRLVCLNGAIVCVGNKQLMYRIHRPVDDSVLDDQLVNAFTIAPERWRITEQNMKTLSNIKVLEPIDELNKELTRLECTKIFIKQAQEAYAAEPLPTMYGLLQAITRAAQKYDDMDQRFDLESLAGRFISNAQRLRPAA